MLEVAQFVLEDTAWEALLVEEGMLAWKIRDSVLEDAEDGNDSSPYLANVLKDEPF